MKELTLIWDNLAKIELQKIYSYFKKKSIQGAENVRDEILVEADKLVNPTVNYAPDPDLGESYRFKIIRKRYRIIYRKTKTEVRIVYIFDTKLERDKLDKLLK
jgi:plasmid stabilization system protein ParE